MKKTITKGLLIALLLVPLSLFAQISVDATSTITWPFNTGLAGQAATFSAGSDAYFSTNWVDNGSNLAYAGIKPDNSINYTGFQPFTQNNAVTDADFVSFNIRPKTGLAFTPTSISFDCERFGTSGGLIDVYWLAKDGSKTEIAKGIVPARNGTATVTHASYNLSTLNIPASSGDCSLLLYIYSLGNTKQVGVANIVVTGTTKGTYGLTPTHKLTTLVTPTGAGTLTVFPVGNEFDEGTDVTITAATRNFGYKFKEWQDASGNVLSTTSPITIKLQKDTTIKAIYETVTTFAFTVDILGSKWGKVSLSPAPTNGRYEAGTTVTMSVAPNKVTNFSYWDDNTTATSRTVLVDGDKAYSATFDEVPFIVGWDFKSTSPNTARPGDYYAVTSNTGLLNIYNQAGTTTSWLGHSGAFSPSMPCAYLWTVSTEFATNRRYFQASFSTEGYNNIQVKSQMAASYQYYPVQKLQISLNGTDFTDIGNVTLSTSVWTDLDAVLTAEFENKPMVYLRWIADVTSTVTGTGNDGTAITNIFVFADKTPVNDTQAPTMVSVVPTENSTNASANGSIVVTFDEKLKIGTGDCSLGSTVLTPVFGSKTVSFTYSKLSYNTDYTFTIPAGALTDLSGNAFAGMTLHFRTMNRPEPIKKVFDAVIAKDGSGDFTSVQAAINAAPSGRALPWLIFIKNGVYRGHVDIPAAKPYINLIGQNRDSVIITDGRLSGSSSLYPDSVVYSVDPGATVVVKSSNCFFENICFENKFGYENLSGPQALALYTLNDRVILNNCWLRSYQDTYLTAYGNVANRHYIKNCRIEGAVDFIYGGGDVFFDRCQIYVNRSAGGYIVAPSHQTDTKWGYVFSSCTIDGPSPSYITYLGRPWTNSPKASFFNTICKIGIYPVGWLEHMGAIPAIFADYNTMDANGSPLDLSNRIDQYWIGDAAAKVWGTAKKSFTDAEAITYNYENVTSGADAWDPRAIIEPAEAPINAKITNSGVLTWEATPYAICYIIIRNHKVIGFTSATTYTDAAYVSEASYKIQAVAESGALSATTVANLLTEVEQLKSKEIIYSNANGIVVSNIEQGSIITVYSLIGVKIMEQKTTNNEVLLPVFENCIIKIKSKNSIRSFKMIR